MKYTIQRPPLHSEFELPTLEALLALKEGDFVKVMFQVEDDVERMWVILKNIEDDSKWIGVLDNDPAGEKISSVLKAGMEVEFHPLDIIQILNK
jgi:hypothetical protein